MHSNFKNDDGGRWAIRTLEEDQANTVWDASVQNPSQRRRIYSPPGATRVEERPTARHGSVLNTRSEHCGVFLRAAHSVAGDGQFEPRNEDQRTRCGNLGGGWIGKQRR
jgi:hypothetical protein